MSGGRTIENFGGAISSYGNKTVFAGITLYYAIAIVLVAVSHLVLTKTRKGKYFIAVGDNAGGANLVGISVLGTKILAYVLCGLFAGLGGFVFASKYGQVMTVAGNGYEMTGDCGVRSGRHFALRRLGQRGRRGNRRGHHVLDWQTVGLYRSAVYLQQHHYRHDADCDCRH